MEVITSFIFFLLIFMGVGVSSIIRNRHTSRDYLMASYSIRPLFVALSAISTNNSGYMFIGMIGYTFTIGLSSAWLMIGWIFGDFLMSLFVYKRLRIATVDSQSLSYSEVLSRWNNTNYRYLRIISGILICVFLGVYASAQLKSGGKALQVLLNWNESVGVIMGAFIVLIYCYAGGIRASVWTDVVQSFVMIGAMFCIFILGLHTVGGWEQFIHYLNSIHNGHYMSMIPSTPYTNNVFSILLFLAGWLFAGFGVIGQPHIIIRFMMMQKPSDISRVRIYYYLWYVLFFAVTIGVGMLARVLLSHQTVYDPEMVLPILAIKLFPGVIAGFVLAGLFAAIMSTADSQILACTAGHYP